MATPLGISTASPPRCSTNVDLAASETAILPSIFSSAERSTGWVASSTLDLRIAVCTVATIGPDATQQASSDREGTAGSWTCSTSKLPSRSQRRTRCVDSGPNASLATDPLYGTGIALPAGTT